MFTKIKVQKKGLIPIKGNKYAYVVADVSIMCLIINTLVGEVICGRLQPILYLKASLKMKVKLWHVLNYTPLNMDLCP